MKNKRTKKSKLLSGFRLTRVNLVLIGLVFALAGVWLLTSSFASYQQKVTNTYSTFHWPSSPLGYVNMKWTLTPLSDPTPQGFFWANQFAISNGSGGYTNGYAGLQSPGNATGQKIAIFSIWNALGATSPGTATPFGNEGSGYKTTIPYNWQPNVSYRFSMAYAGQMSNGNKMWKATVTNLSNNITSEIGTIQVPAAWGGLRERTITFTEYFYGTISSCETIPYTAAKFTDFVANNFQVDVNSSSNTFAYEANQACASLSKVTQIPGGMLHEIGNKTVLTPPPTPTKDTIPPVVSIYEPASGSTLPAGPVRITAAANDASGVNYMEVRINNTVLAKSTNGYIQTTWQATGPKQKRSKAKQYSLKVIAKDKHGNTAQKTYTIYISR